MSKPHEETWTYDVADGYVLSHDGQQIVGRMSATRGPLTAAAPEMARALLEIHEAISVNHLDPDGALEVITRVLYKAGVPLP